MATLNDYKIAYARELIMKAQAQREREKAMGMDEVEYEPMTRSVLLSRRWRIREELANSWGPEQLLELWDKLRDITRSVDFEYVAPGGFLHG